MEIKKDIEANVTLGDLLPAGMTFVVLTVGLAVGAQVLGELSNSFGASTAEKNITGYGSSALLTIGSKLGILATVIILGAVLTVIVRLIQMRFAG